MQGFFLSLAMADHLTIPERIAVVCWMVIYKSPTIVQRQFGSSFEKDPPSRLTIRRIHKKFEETGSVEDNLRGNVGRPRTGRSLVNRAVVEQRVSENLSISTRRCSLQTGIPHTTVWRILRQDLEMAAYHPHEVQSLTNVHKETRVRCCQVGYIF